VPWAHGKGRRSGCSRQHQPGTPTTLEYGIRPNLQQFLHQLLQVRLTIGMMRTVVPALAESEFGVPRNSFMLLTSFVVAFGIVKGVWPPLSIRASGR
jgi:hypothetical protein